MQICIKLCSIYKLISVNSIYLFKPIHFYISRVMSLRCSRLTSLTHFVYLSVALCEVLCLIFISTSVSIFTTVLNGLLSAPLFILSCAIVFIFFIFYFSCHVCATLSLYLRSIHGSENFKLGLPSSICFTMSRCHSKLSVSTPLSVRTDIMYLQEPQWNISFTLICLRTEGYLPWSWCCTL